MTTPNFFTAPGNPDEKIWRYMDFPRYVSLITRGSLYFSRADLLGDPFEGSYPVINKESRDQLADQLLSEMPKDKVPADWKSNFLKQFSDTYRGMSKSIYVNCWHMNQFQSAAMWSIYSKDNKGIAIQSNYKALCDLLPNNFHVGVVNYIDFNSAYLPETNIFVPFVHKRISYQHEQELRAVTMRIDHEAFARGEWPGNQTEGFYLPVDIKRLIDAIYIAPYAEKWYEELVVDVTKNWGLEKFKLSDPL
ncbi:hypothetical protein [Candidatus Villigracilis affinis]|uniref:hypothetical protein n=1 Tax=Candidatus Villigracilis affinis TaxID=3140682 RepID=UPI002A1C41F1|nr:DUF2971 domain-containing protein [Anaerolineales bacterium]